MPTFYLPHEEEECPIPNAIEEVCQTLDKVCAAMEGCSFGLLL
jgi:hypothetical protein